MGMPPDPQRADEARPRRSAVHGGRSRMTPRASIRLPDMASPRIGLYLGRKSLNHIPRSLSLTREPRGEWRLPLLCIDDSLRAQGYQGSLLYSSG